MLLLCTGHVCVCVCHRFANSFLCVRLLWCAVIWSLFTEKLTPVCTRAPQDRVQLDCCWSKSVSGVTMNTHIFFTVSFSYFEVRFFRQTIRTIKIAHILYSYRYIISHTTHKQCQNENVRGLKSWSFTFDSSQRQECSRLSRCLNINLHLVCCYAFQPNRRVFGLFSYLFKHFFFFGWE